jgi:uncharacterized small protein (DUF1192 family)
MFDEEDRPKKKIAHVLGEDLAALSIDELGERIEMLKAEIARLEAAVGAKKQSLGIAASFFKK